MKNIFKKASFSLLIPIWLFLIFINLLIFTNYFKNFRTYYDIMKIFCLNVTITRTKTFTRAENDKNKSVIEIEFDICGERIFFEKMYYLMKNIVKFDLGGERSF